MATWNAASAVRSFGNGGLVTIDANDIDNIIYGSIEFVDVFRPPMPYSNNGTQAQALEGPPQRGSLKIHLRAGSLYTSSAYKNLMTRNSPVDGLVNEFAVVLKIPNYQGAAAGESITVSDFCLSGPVRFRAGGDGQYDTLEIEGTFRTAATIATY